MEKNLILESIYLEIAMKKRNICSLIYKLLSSIMIDNFVNKEKIKQYLPLFAF